VCKRVGRKRERERVRDGEREPKMREGERDRKNVMHSIEGFCVQKSIELKKTHT